MKTKSSRTLGPLSTCVEYLEDIREQLPDQKKLNAPSELNIGKRRSVAMPSKGGEVKNRRSTLDKNNSKTLIIKEDMEKEKSLSYSASKSKELNMPERRSTMKSRSISKEFAGNSDGKDRREMATARGRKRSGENGDLLTLPLGASDSSRRASSP